MRDLRSRNLLRVASLVVAVALASSASGSAAANDWPRYRGSNSDGISTETVFSGLDSVGLKVAWKRAIGGGYSGVSIANGRVVTLFSDGTSDVAAAFDETSGDELWRFVIEPTYEGHDGSHTGPISTPLIDDGRVFGLGARGRLFALDLATGALRWSVDLVAKHGAPASHYGFATSPIVQDGTLIVQLGSAEGAVAGFDPKTGERKWLAGIDTVDCQSPVPFTFDGRRQVVVAGQTKLFGLDPASGEILWTYEHRGDGWSGAKKLVPVPVGNDRIFLGHKDESSSLIQLRREGGAIVATQAWEDRSIHNTYTVPVHQQGYLYGFSSRFLTCIEAATGKTVWRSRPPGDGFLSLVDGHLVILTKLGGLHVAKASPEGYQESASLQLFDGLAWTSPSFADGHIFVRGLDALARVDIHRGQAAAEAVAKSDATPAGTTFAHFLSEVEAAADKKPIVDRFLKSIASYPLVEGDSQVRFLYRGPGLDLAIAGDMIGHRQERSMTRVPGTDLFYFSTGLEPDARVSYVFIRDYEELTDPLNPRKTITTVVGKEMEPTFDELNAMEISWVGMPRWKASGYLGEPDPARRGRLETRRLTSGRLASEHAIAVYLPAGYDAGDRRYPVAIVHGGKAALEHGKLTTLLENMAGRQVAPVILVFVEASPNLFDHGPYAAMIADELIPFVDATYRTMPSAANRAHIGAGWSGYTALYCTLKNPGLVGKLGVHSPVMLDAMTGQLEPMLATAETRPLAIYMDWGKYDLRSFDEAWDMVANSQRLAGLLRERGYRPAGGEIHEGPGWSVWNHRADDLLLALFPLGVAKE